MPWSKRGSIAENPNATLQHQSRSSGAKNGEKQNQSFSVFVSSSVEEIHARSSPSRLLKSGVVWSAMGDSQGQVGLESRSRHLA